MKKVAFQTVSFLICTLSLTTIAGNPDHPQSLTLVKRLSDEVEIKLQSIPKLDIKIEAISKSVNEMKTSLDSKLLSLSEIQKLIKRVSQLESEIQNLKKSKTDAEKHVEKLETDVKRLQAGQNKITTEIQDLKYSKTEVELIGKLRDKVGVIQQTLVEKELQNQQNVENVASTLRSKIDLETTSITTRLNSLIADVRNSLTQNKDKFDRLRRVATDKLDGFWKTPNVLLHYKVNHEGRTETIDFSSCNNAGTCCKTITDLSENAESINTNGACVILYYESNCNGGIAGVYIPGGRLSHTDFGPSKNKYKSMSTCY